MDDLKGFIDIHVHTSPDVRLRKMDDIEAARAAAQAGMAAFLIKSHVTQTADRAAIAQKMVPGIGVYGGLVLNEQTGGFNPVAVEAAIQLGAKIIWMPTISAVNHKAYHSESGGLSIWTEDGRLEPEIVKILELVSAADIALATGHISADEIMDLVPAASEKGVKKIIITHPEVPWIDLSIPQQAALLKYGVLFERCVVSIFEIGGGVPFSRIVEPIHALGEDSTIISTDFGAASLPEPVAGYRLYLERLREAGFSLEQIYKMGAVNPAAMLGLS